LIMGDASLLDFGAGVGAGAARRLRFESCPGLLSFCVIEGQGTGDQVLQYEADGELESRRVLECLVAPARFKTYVLSRAGGRSGFWQSSPGEYGLPPPHDFKGGHRLKSGRVDCDAFDPEVLTPAHPQRGPAARPPMVSKGAVIAVSVAAGPHRVQAWRAEVEEDRRHAKADEKPTLFQGLD